MINNLLDTLKTIITLGLSNQDLYCKTCGTWLKGRNDLNGHNQAFACGIAVKAIKDFSRENTTEPDKLLTDKIAQRLSGLTNEDWLNWKSQPWKHKSISSTNTPESILNEAAMLIELIKNNQWNL